MECIGCIVSGSTFTAKRLILIYSGVLDAELLWPMADIQQSLMAQEVAWTLHQPRLGQQHRSARQTVWHDWWRSTPLPNIPVQSGYHSVASRRRSCALEVNSFTSEWRNLNNPGTEGTTLPLHYLAFNVTMNHNFNRGEWINDEDNDDDIKYVITY